MIRGKRGYMEKKSFKLKEVGVDVDSVVSRLGGKELLYLKICHSFLNDQSFQLFQQSMDAEDFKAAMTQIHTLKGVAANLGFIRMEGLCKNILRLLKCNDITELSEYQMELKKEYTNIIDAINL
jgi:FOG: HPt domain